MKCGIDVNVLARQVPNWNVLLKNIHWTQVNMNVLIVYDIPI
jgi:hypothetical protein